MIKRTSKHDQVSEPSSSTNSNAKMIILKNMKREQNKGVLSNNSILKLCKENITQLNDTNKKG